MRPVCRENFPLTALCAHTRAPAKKMRRVCAQAEYVANAPRELSLNPICAHTHCLNPQHAEFVHDLFVFRPREDFPLTPCARTHLQLPKHAEFVHKLFDFRPVVIDEPFHIHGGQLRCWYTLHSIPALGVEAFFAGKSVAISGDCMYNPEIFEQLRTKGIISEGRKYVWVAWCACARGFMGLGFRV